jgi:hypothetical protein
MRTLAKVSTIVQHRQRFKELIDSYVYFLENRKSTLWGSTSEEDENAIIDLTQRASALSGPIVEVGSLFGFTAQVIAAHKPKEKELLCVENFSWNPFFLAREDHRAITHRVLYYCMRHCNTKLVEANKNDFYDTYNGPKPSMIFIDSCHRYESVMEDVSWAKRMGVPIICGHDYCDNHPGVVRAVNEAFPRRSLAGGSVWIGLPDDD